jgi:hypothetical protein
MFADGQAKPHSAFFFGTGFVWSEPFKMWGRNSGEIPLPVSLSMMIALA